jgi:methylmalonyl-CoA carboxyltransferase large subunit
MKTETPDLSRLAESIGALRTELARLNERVAALEASALSAPQAASPPTAKAVEPLSEELILVISAAVAAFLGKRAHVRQIRLLGSATWGQQGRMTIQASHRLAGRN